LSRRRARVEEKVNIEGISEDVKHMIVYEWAHYTISMDELARKYGLTWDQIYEIIKSVPTRLLWKRPKEKVR